MFDAPSKAALSNIKDQGGQVSKCLIRAAAIFPVSVFVRRVSIVLMINDLFSRNLSACGVYERAAFFPHKSFLKQCICRNFFWGANFEQRIDVRLHRIQNTALALLWRP